MPLIFSAKTLVAVVAIFIAIVAHVSPSDVSSVILDIMQKIFGTNSSKCFPWHGTPQWERFLAIYDEMSTKQFGDVKECSSIVVATSYGPTQTHVCGDATADPVLLFHGATASSLMYGEWLVPDIVSAGGYAIAVDFVCDCGRSAPLDGDPKNCPQDKESLAHWVQEILGGLGIIKPASLVGYSYGSFIASTVAMHKPDLVDKIVLIAPAAVVAPFNIGWLLRAIVFSLVKTPAVSNWFYRYMSEDPEYDLGNFRNFVAASELGATLLAVNPEQLEDDELAKMAKRHPMGLFIGAEETVVSATLAVETAKRAGIETYVYPKTGHLMSGESARDQISLDITSFLVGEKA